MSAKPVAYSYVRFSTKAQMTGDSLRRQEELRDGWLAKTGAVLDTSISLRDLGVSAFTGKHRENPDRHALAAFLELVRRRRIARGSYLVVENLDRLSREHIRPALTLLLNLIDAGVRVVQLVPVEAVYDEDVEPMQLMMAIMELSRGNSESRLKSDRIGKAWREKKRLAAEGVRVTRYAPAWVEPTDDGFRLVPDRAAAVGQVFRLAAAGYGLGGIVKRLNGDGVPPIGGKAPHWTRSYVGKILIDRRAIGEYQPRKGREGRGRKPDGPPVPGYYPAAVTEREWLAARAALAGRRIKAGRPPAGRVNLFAGLLTDARTGGGVHLRDKGPRSLLSYALARADDGVTPHVTFPAEAFEAAILASLREVDPKEILPAGDAAADDAAPLAGRLAEVEAKIKKLEAALLSGPEVETVVNVLRKLEAERAEVGDRLEAARRKAATPLGESWGECQSLAAALADAPDPEDARTRLRGAIRRITERMYCLFVSPPGRLLRLAAVQFHFAGGGRRSYLIEYRPARAGTVVKPTRWLAWSFGEAGLSDGLDLADRKHAARLAAMLADWRGTPAAKPDKRRPRKPR